MLDVQASTVVDEKKADQHLLQEGDADKDTDEAPPMSTRVSLHMPIHTSIHMSIRMPVIDAACCTTV